MSTEALALRHAETSHSATRSIMLAAFVVALILTAIHAAAGFPTLFGPKSDNDSMMRLVEVRDLLAGQGWFDLHQYRMGPDGGFLMHWSRLVDAPIAAIVAAATVLTGSPATAELVALLLWPFLLLVAALACILATARIVGGADTLIPTAIFGGAALHFTGIFAPGALDHHNMQLVLTLGTVTVLSLPGYGPRAAFFAGLMSALTLAVAMEAAPYVAMAGIVVTLAYVVRGGEARLSAGAFGAGFALTALVAFGATVARSQWAIAACDAFSVPQLTAAIVAGFGLALIALSERAARSTAGRLGAVLLLGAALLTVVLVAFPQCLADPYAGLDPKLKENWLDLVTEAQPLWDILSKRPVSALGYYVTPLLGLAVLAWRLRKKSDGTAGWVVAGFLVSAMLVSVWQVRGAMFAVPLASIPLAVWATEARTRARASGKAADGMKMAVAWIVALNMTWGGLADFIAMNTPRTATKASLEPTGACESADDYAALSRQGPGTVLAISNLGSAILRYTGLHVLAGPYHRNIAGNLLALDAWTASIDEAGKLVAAHGIGIVAYCPGNSETAFLAAKYPESFIAGFQRGAVPDWLTPISGAQTTDLRLFEVRNSQAAR